jgi:hypothetical protein
MALATASNRVFNSIIGMVSPDAFAGIHGYFYLIIRGFCLFSAGLTWLYYVETAGHTLEEIAVAFGDKAFSASEDKVMGTADLPCGRRLSAMDVERAKAEGQLLCVDSFVGSCMRGGTAAIHPVCWDEDARSASAKNNNRVA